MMKIAKVVFYCLVGGLAFAPIAMGNHRFAATWFAGITLAAAFVPVALFGPKGVVRQFAAILPVLLLVMDLTLWSEVMIFFYTPGKQQDAINSLVAPAIIYTIVAAVFAVLAVVFRTTHADGPQPAMAPPSRVVLFVLLSGLAYAVYYLIFGAITYQYFTKSYYPDGPQQVARFGVGLFWLVQFARGVLMTLAVLPIVYWLRMTRAQAAIAVAIILWVAGGLTPLLLPNDVLGPKQRIIHTVEIFTQNMSLGVTAVLLLRRNRATG